MKIKLMAWQKGKSGTASKIEFFEHKNPDFPVAKVLSLARVLIENNYQDIIIKVLEFHEPEKYKE